MLLQSNSKIQILDEGVDGRDGPRVIVATTGSVGLGQRLRAFVSEAARGNVFKNLKLREATTRVSTNFLQDCQKSFVPHSSHSGWGFGAILAAVIEGKPHLVEYDVSTFQPEVREDKLHFVSMGSGQTLADPFLAFVSRVLWKSQQPTLQEAKLGVYWALSHTIALAPGGVGGEIKLAALRQVDGNWIASLLENAQEQAEHIEALERSIADYATNFFREASVVPLPPPPGAAAE